MTPAILISVSALIFTVGSFWWLYARPGRLRVSEIRTFGAFIRSDKAALRIPVALYNTGAQPLVVIDLRLDLASAGLTMTAPTRTYRQTLRPTNDDQQDFPHAYVVPGRGVTTKFVEFAPSPQMMATGEPIEANLHLRIFGRNWLRFRHQWRPAGSFPIRTDIIGDPGSYITYSNDSAQWPPGQVEKATEALAIIRAGIH